MANVVSEIRGAAALSGTELALRAVFATVASDAAGAGFIPCAPDAALAGCRVGRNNSASPTLASEETKIQRMCISKTSAVLLRLRIIRQRWKCRHAAGRTMGRFTWPKI